jgi:uncharacterized protein YecT (DUF1311 family)
MKRKSALIISVVLSIATWESVAQFTTQPTITPTFIEHLEDLHQTCLDRGENMWNCSNDFYNQMDSLLNVVYRNIKNKSTSEAAKSLKQDELKWLEKRNKEFIRIDKEKDVKNLGVTDASMVAIDQKAEYVKDRVLFLLKNY